MGNGPSPFNLRAHEPLHRRRAHGLMVWLLLLGAGVAALLIVVVRDTSRERIDHDTVGLLQALTGAAADLHYRPLEGRLSGGFRYRPFVGSAKEDVSSVSKFRGRVISVVDILEKANAGKTMPSLQHRLGIAYLLLGKYDRAVGQLREALQNATGSADVSEAIRRSNEGPLLNDFCVALNARGKTRDRLDAVEAAARARAIWKSDEAVWNHALAVSAIGLNQMAADVWTDYAGRDGRSSWRTEAMHRRGALSARMAARSWSDARSSLISALANSNQNTLRLVVAEFPQQSREWLEESALSDWAHAWLRRDAGAPRQLQAIAEAARIVAMVSGDFLLADHVIALQRAQATPAVLDDAARAQLSYERSRSLYEQAQYSKSIEQSQHALHLFEAHSFPFRHLAATTLASCHFVNRNYVLAGRLVEVLITDPTLARRCPSVSGRAYWIRGLVTMETGDPRDSVRDYASAIERFQATREIELLAAVTVLRAQAEDGIGLFDDSWSDRFRAFGLHVSVQSVRWRHGILVEGALAAIRSRHFAMARLLLDHLVTVDTSAQDDVGLAATLRLRSMLHHALADVRAAELDLTAAQTAAARIRDDVVRQASMTRIETTAAQQMVQSDPAAALRILTRTQSSLGTVADVADTTLGLSSVLANDSAAAINVLIATIDALEARLPSDDEAIWRSPLAVQPLISLYDQAILLCVKNGRARQALALSERARRSSRRLNGYPVADAAIDPVIPSDSAALIFYVAGEDVISWSVRKEQIHALVHPHAAAEMRRLVVESTGEPATRRGKEAALRLAQLLVIPQWDIISGAARLLVVPDDALWTVPIAALRGPDGRYLAQSFIVALLPSLRESATCEERPAGMKSMALLIGAADPGGSSLRPLPQVSPEIAGVQRTLEANGTASEHAKTAGEISSLALRATLIHFAGHGVPNATVPGLSFLQLDGGQRLYGRDIARWRLRGHPLIVLSACEGALRSGKHLEAWSSIGDAFARAGATGFIAAMGPVGDDDAQSFIRRLYPQLMRSDPAAALNEAQRAAIREHAPPSWSSFVYIAGNCR